MQTVTHKFLKDFGTDNVPPTYCKRLFYLTLLYAKNPNMSGNKYGGRNLRINYYIEMAEFDRLSTMLPHLSEKGLSFMFPWLIDREASKDKLGPLPAIEESLKLFEETIGEIS